MKQSDINSDRIDVSNTPIESNKNGNENFSSDEIGFLSTKKGKIIVFSIIGVVLIALIIGIAVACSQKGGKSDEANVPEPNGPGEQSGNGEQSGTEHNPNINYKKNDVSL